ncbi:MAG: DUF3408 domain-containing protein [Dysgonamonadaceae bacterium]|jgi:hypothetical protein|nr:DUF3408 domain-containing protein [Dysgonamonadaceae bacterium]
MAKKINVDEIDESFIVAAVRKDRVQSEIIPPPLAPLPATVPAESEQFPKEEKPAFAPELPKEESKKKRGKHDYEALFIRESNVTARLGKTVYIRKEFHDRIQKIVQVIGENEISLFSYIDNIIAHHFEMFQEDIVQSYNQKNNSIF